MHEESTSRHKEAVVSLRGESSPLGQYTTSAIKFKRMDLTGAAAENGCTGVTYKVGHIVKGFLRNNLFNQDKQTLEGNTIPSQCIC